MTFNVTPERQKRKVYTDAIPAGEQMQFAIDDFFDCLRACPRWAPKALAMRVRGEFIGTDEEEFVTVLVVPTAIHTVYDYYPGGHHRREEHEKPEYEFEGWLLGDYPEKIWVIGSLLVDGGSRSPNHISLVSLCRLESGEQIGTAFNPLVKQ